MVSQTASSIKEIVITREFDAPRERVWQAWTDPEMVQRWYGPEGFTAPSIKIDLRVGGKYIWAMRGPAGSPMDRLMYIAGVYKEIVPNEKLVVVEYRSDENGDMLSSTGSSGQAGDFPSQMTYTVRFEELAEGDVALHHLPEARDGAAVPSPAQERHGGGLELQLQQAVAGAVPGRRAEATAESTQPHLRSRKDNHNGRPNFNTHQGNGHHPRVRRAA